MLSDQHRDFWRRKLADVATLELPTDRPRSLVPARRGAAIALSVPLQLRTSLEAVGRAQGADLPAALLAGFSTLLHRYTGQDVLCIGASACGAEPVVLRIEAGGNPAFGELVYGIGRTWVEANTHREPLADLLTAVDPSPDPSRSPLFQAGFSIEEQLPAAGQQRADGLDLSVRWKPAAGALEGLLCYCPDLFEPGTIERMAGHLVRLFEDAAAHPDRKIGQLGLLSEAERHQLLIEWNDTAADYPKEKCIHQLFEQQVERTPGAIALVAGLERLSYRQLDQRANQLAARLVRLGAGPDRLVALCVERSAELVVGLLGILKAGAAYVPVDPNYPRERIAYLLADSGAPLLVTHERLRGRLPPHQAQLVWIDALPEAMAPPPIPRARPANLAYLIYTSGSTGKPKAVAVEHRNAVSFLTWAQRQFGPQRLGSVLASTSICFDLSVFEIFATLASGGSLFVAENALQLPSLPAAGEVALVNTVPSAMSELVKRLPSSVRTVNLAGEPLKDALVQQLYGLGHIDAVYDLYGPSETTTYSTFALRPRGGGSRATIGKPLANTQVYVLDRALQPVPVGVRGELYLGGAGVTRGYLGRPDLTAERYLPNPFSSEPGARLYRSGDLARFYPDGNLEYLGRTDHQVKLRGFRIELGEIEAALLAQPGVREAVVLAREDVPGDQRLVAYLVAEVGATPSADGLRPALARSLPEYMVPAAFVTLPSLPLTPNGKLDRKALPAPEWGGVAKAYVAPRTPAEEVLCGIWAEVLKLPRVGVEDDFLALGGHSLMAARVIARASAAFKVELPLRSLFERRTVRGLAEGVEAAVRTGASLGGVPPLVPVLREGNPALSFAQQRLWLVDQLEPGLSVYNVPSAWRLDGRLDPQTLERSLNALIERHEALRTTFTAVGGVPRQLIAPRLVVTIPVVELGQAPAAEGEEHARRLAAAEANRPFDLERGPLLRAQLLRLGEQSHLLLLTIHHIVSDGWTIGLLGQELTSVYAALSRGEPAPLLPLPLQYADYAAWQQRWLQGEVLDSQLAYWKQQLDGAPPTLELPTDRPRPPAQTHRGAQHRFLLPKSLAAALVALGLEEGVTPFMTLLAGFNLLLHRHSGQDEVCVGTPIAGRTRPELEGLVGFFVNTLVLRTDLSGQPTFRQLLGRVRELALDAYAHQHVPFEKLVEVLQPERSLDRNPLFQVLFAYEDIDTQTLELPGLRVTPLRPDVGTEMFDLSLSIAERQGSFEAALSYNTDLFDPGTIERMSGHLVRLLEEAAAAPDRAIGELELLSAAERQQVLVEWNDTTTQLPSGRCIHQLFEEQARATPDALAVEHGDARLSYRELDERSNQLAHYLRQLGVRPEQLVGICVERSVPMVVGLLGILKAGAAYVPLDPGYPRERLEYMQADSGLRVLLTQHHLAARLPPAEQVVALDSQWTEISRGSGKALPAAARPGNRAYVIYTSGSTGRPKAVEVEHRSTLNLIGWHLRAFGMSARDRTSQLVASSFDAAVLELWPTLACGASLHITPEENRVAPAALRDWLLAKQVTMTVLPTPIAEALLELDWPAQAPLRWVFAGGDRLQRVPARAYPFAFVNGYGPTENTVMISSYPVSPGQLAPPIGRPIANVRAYLLDRHQRPVPVGVSGELYAAGSGVARGYLHRPELTAERFLPDPFGPTPGERMYRTGDLARWLPDGQLEYLGRADFQVKIRGFRVELGEIESALLAVPPVSEVVVVAREEAAGDKRLVAYVVAKPGATVSTDELRARLARSLPGYMVPSAVVLLPALPLTRNGKVDRRALPAPEWAAGAQAYLAPRTPLEEVLCAIWAEVLRVEQVGVEHDFFALGGHSLMAARVMARVCEAFDLQLPLRTLFERKTVAGLAEAVEAARRAGTSGVAAPPLVRTRRDGNPELSFAQQRLWVLDQLDPGRSVYNVSSAWRTEGQLDAELLERSLNALLERHEALRTTFRAAEGVPCQLIAPRLQLTIPVVDLRQTPAAQREEQARGLTAAEAARPFDLEKGPLLRALLLRLGHQSHLLLLTMHHIISDAWTMGLVGQELTAVYGGFLRGEPPPLAPLAIQYADYAAWQRQWLHGDALERQLLYWKKQLGGAPPTLELATDHPRPAVQSRRGAHQSFVVPLDIADGLKALGRSESATPFMTLLAGFKLLLHRHCGQQELCVGTPLAGRTRTELEGLAGFFVNTLVIRTDLSGRPTFRQLLARVREAALGAYSHQDVPFEKLVEVLKPERSLGRNPLFQVMFAYEDLDTETLELPGLRVTPVRLDAATELFDLTLSVREVHGSFAAVLSYSTDLFDQATIARMSGHLVRLLEDAVAHPDRPIGELELLSAAERRQVLVEWNDTATDYRAELCVHQLFEEQARRTPDAVAIEFEGERLTYAELDQRATGLAGRLRRLGVGPEVRVALCVERSLQLVVGLLGVLKAGGAYVPLDPDFPKDRLSYMLVDSRAAVLLTRARLLAELPPTTAALCLLDGDDPEPDQAPPTGGRAAAGNLAYLIYTSGSTGKPKGVGLTHRNAVSFLAAMDQRLGREPGVWLAVTTISFDIAGLELFWTLSRGFQVVIHPELGAAAAKRGREGLLVSEALARHRATHFQATPSLYRALLLEPGARAALGRLRKLLVGGEALAPDLAAELTEAAPGEVLNMYGPTETTIWSSTHTVAQGKPVAIGRPIANTRMYVLDPNGNPTPPGVAGELHIGGPGVARGYWERPETTAERFLPDPFGAEGGRMYRTGDRVRSLADGSLEYLGRTDFQVKVRGFRIELGEIEAALLAQPGVREAVVLAREDVPGDRRLVAYLTANEGAAVSADGLRAALKQSLPGYMVPAAFLLLPALPLTPNGKADRKALPAPEWGGDDRAYLAPRTPLEEQLCGIWAEVLRLPRVGVEDDFFALGGHSLMATRVAARVSKLGSPMTAQMLFQYPTVAQLAQALGGPAGPADEYSHWRGIPPVSPGPRTNGEVPLSFPEERLLTAYLHRDPPVFNVQWDGRYLEGPLDLAALIAAFDEYVRRTDVIRSRFWERGGQLGKSIEPAAAAPVELVDLRGEPESSRVTRAFTHAFGLIHGPRHPLADSSAVRLCIYRLGEQRHLLSFTAGHLIYDFNSFPALWDGLKALYQAYSRGEAPPEASRLQYADFARWQRKHLAGRVLDEGRAFWSRYLAGATPLLRMLPTDLPWGPVDEDRARDYLTPSVPVAVEIEIPAPTVEKLLSLARRHRASQLAVAYGAFSAVMARESNQPDVVISNVNDLRGRIAGLEGMFGLLTNNSPLRLDVPGSLTFNELVTRAREAVLTVYTLPEFQIIPHFYPTMNDMLRVVFNFRPEGEGLTFPGCTTARAEVPEGFTFPRTPGFLDLMVQVDALASGEWVAAFVCNSRLRTRDTARRYAERYLRLLQAAAEAPARRLDQLWE